jgi:hypothetical protein
MGDIGITPRSGTPARASNRGLSHGETLPGVDRPLRRRGRLQLEPVIAREEPSRCRVSVVHFATLGVGDREAAFVATGQVAQQNAVGSGTPSFPRER